MGQLGEKVVKKVGEKLGEKTGKKVGEGLGKIDKLNLCLVLQPPRLKYSDRKKQPKKY